MVKAVIYDFLYGREVCHHAVSVKFPGTAPDRNFRIVAMKTGALAFIVQRELVGK